MGDKLSKGGEIARTWESDPECRDDLASVIDSAIEKAVAEERRRAEGLREAMEDACKELGKEIEYRNADLSCSVSQAFNRLDIALISDSPSGEATTDKVKG